MTNPSDIMLYGAILISIALGFLLLALFITYFQLLKKHTKLKEEKGKGTEESQRQAVLIVDQARKQSTSILAESQQQAAELIKDAGTISQEAKQRMIEEMSKVAQGYAKNYQELLVEVKNEALGVVRNISQSIKGESAKEIEAMKQALTGEIVKAQEITRKAITESLSKVETEVNAYKQARIKRVDVAIFDIIREASQKVIGKSLNTKEHEDLVIKSLEEAKKERVL